MGSNEKSLTAVIQHHTPSCRWGPPAQGGSAWLDITDCGYCFTTIRFLQSKEGREAKTLVFTSGYHAVVKRSEQCFNLAANSFQREHFAIYLQRITKTFLRNRGKRVGRSRTTFRDIGQSHWLLLSRVSPNLGFWAA